MFKTDNGPVAPGIEFAGRLRCLLAEQKETA